MTAPRHLLITGGAGYVGRHVIASALAAGHRVRATLRDPAKAPEPALIGGQVEWVRADLLRDAGWEAAFDGIDALLHTASPVPIGAPKRDEDVIRPALEGTERVLRAAARAGLRRVVLTSSIAAMLSAPGKPAGAPFGAEDWTDATDPANRAYARAKTLAEQAAHRIAAEAGMSLIALNPGVVFGAPRGGGVTSSLALIDRLIAGRDPLLPRLAIPCVTAGDVAEAHLAALAGLERAAPGARVPLVADTVPLRDIAEIVRRAVPEARPSRGTAPDWLVRAAARLSPSVRAAAGGLGRVDRVETETAATLLGRPLSDPRAAIAETARALAAMR